MPPDSSFTWPTIVPCANASAGSRSTHASAEIGINLPNLACMFYLPKKGDVLSMP
jgi:hypothetical protein